MVHLLVLLTPGLCYVVTSVPSSTQATQSLEAFVQQTTQSHVHNRWIMHNHLGVNSSSCDYKKHGDDVAFLWFNEWGINTQAAFESHIEGVLGNHSNSTDNSTTLFVNLFRSPAHQDIVRGVAITTIALMWLTVVFYLLFSFRFVRAWFLFELLALVWTFTPNRGIADFDRFQPFVNSSSLPPTLCWLVDYL